MKFSVLTDILQNAGLITDVKIDKDCEIVDLTLMDSNFQDFNDSTVYFIHGADIGFGTKLPQSLLYSDTIPEFRAGSLQNSARIVESLPTAFRYVKSQLDTSPLAQIQYSETISKLVMGKDLNYILTELFNRTGNQFAAIDLSGKILANSSPFYVDYSLWMQSVQQGYCDDLLMDYINYRRENLHVPKGPDAFSLYCSKINMYILVARILDRSEPLGYLFAINSMPNFDTQTQKLMPLLAQRAGEAVLRLKNANYNHNMFENSILLDAIKGASSSEVFTRAQRVHLKISGHIRVLVIRSPSSHKDQFLSRSLLPQVADLLNNQPCFLYKHSIVAIAQTDAEGFLSPELVASLEKFFEENNLLAGVSNHFSDISTFAEYYQQATTALTMSGRFFNEHLLRYYLDCAVYVLLNQVEDDKLLEECSHPALAQLLEYDRQKKTDFFDTLRILTQSGFNKNRTAQLLFVHRNTINYRIQQIEDICKIDLSDERLLFTMQLSFCIYTWQKNRYLKD
ncbi:MAG: helix-turn-helix domain-containing protein [Oscillibacter sp.]|jgi:hypothetical protein|nr:helix-turn-helix domain-containing protein [Oscillibacter sp.]